MTYEFNAEDSIIIKNVATRAVVQALLLGFGGFIALLVEVINADDNSTGIVVWLSIQAILQIGIGILFFRPSDNFRRVAITEGKDVEELMTGLKELSWGFKMIAIIVIVSFAIDIILIAGYDY